MKKFLSAVLALAMAFALCTTAFAADPTVKVTTEPAADEGSAALDTNSWQVPVPAQYVKETATKADVTTKYYVVVEWECMNNSLTYTVGKDTYEWTVADSAGHAADATSNAKPASAGYTVTKNTNGTWNENGEANYKVTVTNWSNAKVDAKLSWTPAGVAGNVTKAIVTTTKFDSDAAAATEKTLTLEAADKDVITLPDDTNVALVNTAPSASSTLNIKVTDGAIAADNTNIGTLTITVINVA